MYSNFFCVSQPPWCTTSRWLPFPIYMCMHRTQRHHLWVTHVWLVHHPTGKAGGALWGLACTPISLPPSHAPLQRPGQRGVGLHRRARCKRVKGGAPLPIPVWPSCFCRPQSPPPIQSCGAALPLLGLHANPTHMSPLYVRGVCMPLGRRRRGVDPSCAVPIV